MSNGKEERCECGDPIWADTENMKEPKCYECFIGSLEEAHKRIAELENLLNEASNLIRLSQTRLSTATCENGKTLGENYSEFLINAMGARQVLAKIEKGD